jgi:hypothetical protein
MEYLYWFVNLLFTGWLLSPALSVVGYIYLSLKAKILSDTIKPLIIMSSIYLILYIVFMGISYYFLGYNVFISMAVNIILILLLEWKKFLGIDPSIQENFKKMFHHTLNSEK